MKSEKSMPRTHTTMPAGKDNHPSAPASAGTSETPGMKSNEGDVQLGEGLDYGAVHKAHSKHQVKDAKEVKGLQMSAQAAHERRENGNADPCGDCE
jgi:hypothetical protein